jgi:DNA-binding XRE family transcriptional regulator
MNPEERITARRQLDKRLSTLQGAGNLARPPRGWIRAIREALGMTTAQLAKRLGVSQPRAIAIQKAEISGSITLGHSMKLEAQGLDRQDEDEQLKKLIDKVITQGGSKLWEDK